MIEVDQLTKVYGAARAIDGLTFSIERGEIVGFLGPNGAGKTTTMRILAGAMGATSGRARIGGVDVLARPREVRAMVGYLPERPPLYPEMTVRSYVLFCARIKGASDPRAAAERAIARTGLTSVAHRLIDNLSKGYKQRVGIAQALVHDPRVLILDEPASGLDPAQRVEIRKLVRELAEGDTTVLLSTHVLPEVEAVCGRVIIVDRGVIRRIGPVGALHEGAVSDVRVVLRRPSPEAMQALAAVDGVTDVTNEGSGAMRVQLARDARDQVAAAAVPFGLLELRSVDNLEQLFLQLTGQEAP